ncbi:MAG: DUF4124 domain-containing protein [Duganella sp.]
MHPHLRAPCAALLCAAALHAVPAAHAQDIHKCTTAGRIIYSDRPCPADATTAGVLTAPAAPAAGTTPAPELTRMRREALALEKARVARESQERRADARAAQAAATQRRKCDRLRLQRQWADDDVRRATAANATTLDKARIKAQRAADAWSIECAR